MSNLAQRRSSPHRRISGSRMHPGWSCFLLAFGAGIMWSIALALGIRWLPGWDRGVPFFVVSAIGVALFILAGRKAETLTDR